MFKTVHQGIIYKKKVVEERNSEQFGTQLNDAYVTYFQYSQIFVNGIILRIVILIVKIICVKMFLINKL